MQIYKSPEYTLTYAQVESILFKSELQLAESDIAHLYEPIARK